jgi:hypothetical protein
MKKPNFWRVPFGLDDGPSRGPVVTIVDDVGRIVLVVSCNDEWTGEYEWFFHNPQPSQKQRRVISRLKPDPDGRVRVSSRYRPRSRTTVTKSGDSYMIDLGGILTVPHDILLPALEKRVTQNGVGATLTLTVAEIRDIINKAR